MSKLDGIDFFTRAYLECALWSSVDNSNDQGGEPLDKNYDITNFAHEALEKIKAECKKFQEENANLLSDLDDAQSGHDFWLTRNHHGSGFWDRDFISDDLGEKLTKASYAFPECDIYIGDDGLLYVG